MKPVYILALVGAALAGGLIVKFTQKPSQPLQSPVAQVQQQAQAPVPETTPAPVAAPAVTPEPEKPSALPPKREARVRVPKGNPEPVAAPPSEPPNPAPVQTASAPPAPSPSPEPAPVVHAQPVIPQAPPPPPPPRTVTIDAGTLIQTRLIDGVSTDRNKTGDTFMASLDKALVIDGVTIAERGARAEGKVINAVESGRVRGVASLQVALTKIHTADGQVINVDTDGFSKEAEPTKGEDAKKVGVGAALGGIIGAIAGGGKGAAIGAATGAGAGGGVALATRGEPARLPSETRISFRLRAPVTYTEKR
jgi:hypothetical protein